ncbi:MAG: HDIG domain-containing protein [Chloroflexi bacterium]|nr:HDIG domain-containing protein [Chloroflexota bacterium]
MPDRAMAMALVNELVKTDNIRKHLLATEAIMRGLARLLEPGAEEAWGLTGLLHDADYEATEKDVARHTDLVAELMRARGFVPEIIDAVRGHADKVARTTTMAKAMYACDALAGLITAAALVRPDKKLAGLTAESVLKRFREKSFARGANREEILTCETELRMPLADFIRVCLAAMQEAAESLGL